ncbi:MAG: hypothetical protein J6B45_01820 [Clostridia bacterium]|nr:hypothetical protein [Clostridia bacterium]
MGAFAKRKYRVAKRHIVSVGIYRAVWHIVKTRFALSTSDIGKNQRYSADAERYSATGRVECKEKTNGR